jgi:excinuclease ABC subunit B
MEPRSIIKSVDEIRFTTRVADARDTKEPSVAEALTAYGDLEPEELIERLEAEMKRAAERLDFERAASIRDELFDVKSELEPGRRPRSPRSRLGALKRSRR